MFVHLAYDVRKAYERQRGILEPPEHYEEMGIRYGVKILWPVLLLQQRMLRCSLGYLDHAAKTQAIAYALEAIIEEALLEDFQAQGKDVITGWQRVDPGSGVHCAPCPIEARAQHRRQRWLVFSFTEYIVIWVLFRWW